MNRKRVRGLSVHVILVLGVVISVFPFYWIVVMATNTSQDIYSYPPKLWFGGNLLTNVQHLFDRMDFFGSLSNTVIVAVCTTALVLFFDSLAAFAFAKYDFPGKKFFFGVLLSMYLLPTQLAIIPQYEIMVQLGWLGTLKALVVPAAANAFGIFWMRQYTTTSVPDELLDAARIEGAGFFRLYWHVVLPCVRPALAFLGIYTFIAAWNDYILPLVMLVNPDRLTLQVALAQLYAGHSTDYSMVMAGVLLSVIPLVLVFTFFARGFIADATKGALR
ncbi:sugar ABC transporter permease [Streptomyces sp. NRRL WC-3618]|uniref:carbohydrate ABC transporter permease n=1 Tax=Streptomyces sp. NRRL WC-3618 TaxID=1519490 RepID=UPI0006AEC01E|nr:carbohydrate ABC transporter permease [Streptomyces sp. NRRL WC-3618]KOV74515.1 sugar ABC transporter permease [Streptomyces sp. NRRL WC-3618]